jgi:hypothetical protein
MAHKELKSRLQNTQSINPGAKTNATVNGTAVDLFDYDAALIVAVVGTRTDGTHLLSAEESDDNSTFTAVAAGDLKGTFPADVTSNTPIVVAYLGKKRYIRAKAVTSGATTGAVFGVNIITGLGKHLAP